MKNIVNKIFNSLARLFYPGFNVDTYSKRTILAMIFYQKILRINGSVPWPVHFTSKVKAPKKIARGTKAPGFSRDAISMAEMGLLLERTYGLDPTSPL